MGVRGRKASLAGPHLPLEALISLGSVTPARVRILSSAAPDQQARAAPALNWGKAGPVGLPVEAKQVQGVTGSSKMSFPYLPEASRSALREGRGRGEQTWRALSVWGARAI